MHSNESEQPVGASLEVYLLGSIDFAACTALQQRLVYETSGRTDGLATVLVCEHPEIITVGRGGSRWDIQLDEHELTSRQVEIQWVNRGGGCMPHAPGQLAIYPIIPLSYYRWTVGHYLAQLQLLLESVLQENGIRRQVHRDEPGIWGRTGQLAAVGAAVKGWTTYHGAFINVSPAMHLFNHVRTSSVADRRMSSLMIEGQKPVRMTQVRSALARLLPAVFPTSRCHIYSSHPLLARTPRVPSESARVG